MRIVYKKIGETPLQCIQCVFPDDGVKRTYAGRLDPMAEGLLLILEGEECKEAKNYFNLDKVYEYSFALGVSTDTYDCLGRITDRADVGEDVSQAVRAATESLNGDVTLPYPPYSSKTVDGVPLFVHARRGGVPSPERTVHIHTHTVTGSSSVPARELARNAIRHIRTVRGDFRQEESVSDWESVSSAAPLPVFSAVLHGSGGVYIRAVVNEISRRIEVPAVTVSIRRTGIGDWNLDDIHGQQPSASG